MKLESNNIYLKKSVFGNAVCKMAAILLRPQYIKDGGSLPFTKKPPVYDDSCDNNLTLYLLYWWAANCIILILMNYAQILRHIQPFFFTKGGDMFPVTAVGLGYGCAPVLLPGFAINR